MYFKTNEEKRVIKYRIKKLTIGVVSCAIGCVIFYSATKVYAEEMGTKLPTAQLDTGENKSPGSEAVNSNIESEVPLKNNSEAVIKEDKTNSKATVENKAESEATKENKEGEKRSESIETEANKVEVAETKVEERATDPVTKKEGYTVTNPEPTTAGIYTDKTEGRVTFSVQYNTVSKKQYVFSVSEDDLDTDGKTPTRIYVTTFDEQGRIISQKTIDLANTGGYVFDEMSYKPDGDKLQIIPNDGGKMVDKFSLALPNETSTEYQ